MAWLINDYNASTPLYVNNIKWGGWNYKNYLYCYNPPELRYKYLYKLSGDFCLNKTVEEEETVLQVCGENDEENGSLCSCEKENLKCNSLENTNIEISENKTVEIKSIQIIHGNISHLNLKKLLPARQSSIESLHFYQTNIRSIENGTFDNFTSLKALDLSENLLTLINEKILTKQIGSTLIELDLNSNRLTLLSPNTFIYLTKLKVLKLSNNLLLNLSSNIFSKSLASLEHLDISSCNISNLMDDLFVNLSNLTHLRLSGNPITTFPTAINFLPKLQFLEISTTKITVLKNSGTKINKNLKYLHGYSTKIERIENCAFCNFPNLKEVNFDFSNALSFIDENAFGFAHSRLKPSLEKFSIFHCNFTTLPESLLNWNSLKHFDAAANPFNCNCSMNWLIKLIKEKSDSIKHSFYECSNPSEFKFKTFLKLPETFCNETFENSTTSIPSTSTTPLPVTVTEAATSPFNGHLMLIILMILLFFIIAFAIIVGGYYYYQNRKIIQIPRNGEDDEDLIEEDFDTENV
uniref:LRRCT domain-containing protein n=1 Tax=Panagrolaimus davidi TaxID=227884 RepID=A0A914QWW5_9BILA